MKKSCIVPIFAILAIESAAQAQNLLSNGNLDQTYQQEIVPSFELPKPTVWINEGTRTLTGAYEDEMQSVPWGGPAPTPVTTGGASGEDNAVFFKPFSGNVSPNGPATGHLYQDVPGIAGALYQLSGWAGAESNALMADAVFAIEFLDSSGNEIPLSGTELSLLPTLFVDNGQPFDYKQYTLQALAPIGTEEVRARVSMINATANPAGGGQAFVVDDFELTIVPEPSSALAIAGLAGLLLARRRR